MRRLWPLAFLVLVYPLVAGSVWLFSDPLYDDRDVWHLEARVVETQDMEVPHRFEPLLVAHVEVESIVRQGAGPRPGGTIEVVAPEYAPGHGKLAPGRHLTLALSPYEMHDPQTQQPTFEGYLLQDTKSGCCWTSRIGQADETGLMLLLGALAVGAVAWFRRTPLEWVLVVPLVTGAAVALLAGAWSNESLALIQGDGEENYDVSGFGLLVAAIAWLGLAALVWISRRRPVAWVFAWAVAFVLPMAATDGTSGDFDLARAALVVPVLAVLLGQRQGPWRWVSAGVATALLVPLAFLAVMAYQAPYGSDPVAGGVLMAFFAGMYVPVVVDGLWAWPRPAPRDRRAP